MQGWVLDYEERVSVVVPGGLAVSNERGSPIVSYERGTPVPEGGGPGCHQRSVGAAGVAHSRTDQVPL